MTRRHWLSFGFLAILLCTSLALADDDPPSRVVRLKYVSGQVAVQPGGLDEWVAGVVNRPLTTSDRIWTDRQSRAELHLDNSAMRMDQETSVTFANVGDNAVQLELHQGTLNLRVMRLFEGETYEVDTPNVAFTVLAPGQFRFNVDAGRDTTEVIVWQGAGDASGDDQAVALRSGQRALFFGGTSLSHAISAAPAFDAFDEWCQVLDEQQDRAESAQYVSPDVIGYEDLDNYGQWTVTTDYGPVWTPASVGADWAPYQQGHWIWLDPWGWTWVDEARWGFAPFHYGRWIRYREHWAWCPGPRVARPYYAPALVAWIGGGHWRVGASTGAGGVVGWFPLGYGEPYLPHYRASRNYFQRVNITNTRITNITQVTNNYYDNANITNIGFVNRRVGGAVTAAPRDAFVNSRPIARSALSLSARQLEGAPVERGPWLTPSRNSVLGSRAGTPAVAPRPAAVSRPVVSRLTPPPSAIPFAARQQALEANGGRPLDAGAERELRMRTAPRTAPAAAERMAPARPVDGAAPVAPVRPSAAPAITAEPNTAQPASPVFVPRRPERGADARTPDSTPPSEAPRAPDRFQRAPVMNREPGNAIRPAPALEQPNRPIFVPRPQEQKASPEPQRPPTERMMPRPERNENRVAPVERPRPPEAQREVRPNDIRTAPAERWRAPEPQREARPERQAPTPSNDAPRPQRQVEPQREAPARVAPAGVERSRPESRPAAERPASPPPERRASPPAERQASPPAQREAPKPAKEPEKAKEPDKAKPAK